jgi:aminoglycoside phosphotransferase (APT) family kinase protein
MNLDINHVDAQALTDYLSAYIDGLESPLSITKFAGGQSNPTFKLQNADRVLVLRRQPPGTVLKSAHAVDREYQVLKALAQTEVPVAKVYHLCTDTRVIGSMFYVMEYVQGRVLWNSALPDVTSNTERSAMYAQMLNVLSTLHQVNFTAIGLAEYGKAGNYFERQFSRWSKQYQLSQTHKIAEMDQLMAWLEKHLPADDGRVSLVHGDFRMDNLMFHPIQTDIVAVLDWELSTLGHPFADLAYQCMQLRLPDNVGQATGLGGVDRQALGIPSEKEYVAEYCKLMGIEGIDNWPFYLAFSFFRLAAIAQGVAKRAESGNASSSQARQVGAMVQPLARMALDLIH